MERVKKSSTSPGKVKQAKRNDAQGKKLFLLILPFLILTFMFSYFPLHGWIYAFYDYRAPLKLSQCQFVGLKWFKTLFSNSTQVSQLLQVMKNTFAMSLLGIATSFLPVLFAVFLNEIKCKWFKNVVQTLTTLPNFISWTLVYAVAFALFSTTGMANSVLQQIGLITEPIKFLDSRDHIWLKMILWSTWKGLGWGAIMYLAAIAGIDQEMFEAAKVDGTKIKIKSKTDNKIKIIFLLFIIKHILSFKIWGKVKFFNWQNRVAIR